MKNLILLFIISSCYWTNAQLENWFSGEVNTEFLDDRLKTTAQLNIRTSNLNQLEQFFPEVSARYKVSDFFKPSIDYRFIIDRNNIGNYNGAHRINANLNFKQDIEQLSFKFRLRYQYKIESVGSSADYQPDFDNAIRLRPVVEYNIEDSKLDPYIGAEWFYNPQFGPLGRRYTKIRFSSGVTFDLPNKQEIGVKYQFDYEINVPNPERVHILSMAYSWDWKRSNKK